MIKVSVARKDDGRVTWAELQRIKNELLGSERTGIEVLPRDSELLDKANIYHFWVLPEDVDLPFGFNLPGAFGTRKAGSGSGSI